MTHCRECNSEIAEAEAFCPYCGISIKPLGVDGSDSAIDEDGEQSGADVSSESQEPDIDMSETVVTGPEGVFASIPPEDQVEEDDAGFVDISELKSETSEQAEGDEEAETSEDASSAIGEDDAGFVDISELKSETSEQAEGDEEADTSEDAGPEDGEPEGDESSSEGEIPDESEKEKAEIDAIEKEIDRAVSVIAEKADGSPGETDSEADAPGPDEDVINAAEELPPSTTEDDSRDSKGVEDSESPEISTAAAELSDDEFDESSAKETEPEHAAPLKVEETATEVQPEAGEVASEPDVPLLQDPVQEIEPVIDDAEMEATLIAGSFDIDPKAETPIAATPIEESVPPEEPETSVATDQELETKDDAPVKTEAEESDSGAPDLELRKEPEATGAPVKSEIATGGEEPEELVDADVAAAKPIEIDVQEPAVDATGEPKEKPPGTTPNIGVGDTDGSKTPKLRPLDEGTVLNDRYEIVRKIGGGGMGAVYLASDKNLGGVLRAVKEMVQSYIEKEQQEKAIQDFKRESMLLTSLEHSAIPTIYDYFYAREEARFYLVMKYISGGDLAARLRSAPEGRLDELSVTQWAIEISDVLAYLHDRQPPIVYRDLKPANIMIDGNSSKIMLIDFGIARWVNKEEKGVTAVGTMGYAPPELFSGNVVPSSDIYSLGSTMFHLLTGADPQNNPLLIFDFQKHPRPRQINPNLSDQMERILMRSVEYNSESRFVSAAEMRGELERHLQSLKTGQVSYGIKETPAAVALSDQPVFCGFCGQKIVATDMFCAFCGAKQPLAQPGVQSQEYVLPQTTARLVVEGTGDLTVPTFDLGKKENLVGRRDPMSNIFPEVDLSKYDPQTKISRKHARIWRDGDIYMLEDLGSSNGTMVIQSNSDTTRLAPHQSRALNHGDKIQVGDTTLAFVLG